MVIGVNKKINLDYQLFLQRENNFYHQPYTNELNFYDAIRAGNIDFIETCKKQYGNAKQEPLDTNGKGVLSDNPVRNERYHLIVNVALITRCCIEGGLSQEEAYTLSDLYIRQADVTSTTQELQKLNDEMVREFTLRMKTFHTEHVVSRHISSCIHYIYNHLNERITIQTLGKVTGLNPCYLSTLFKKETGTTIHRFIQNKRLETARNMLKKSNYSCTEISSLLGFSSQSHFIQCFQKKYRITPAEYQKNPNL